MRVADAWLAIGTLLLIPGLAAGHHTLVVPDEHPCEMEFSQQELLEGAYVTPRHLTEAPGGSTACAARTSSAPAGNPPQPGAPVSADAGGAPSSPSSPAPPEPEPPGLPTPPRVQANGATEASASLPEQPEASVPAPFEIGAEAVARHCETVRSDLPLAAGSFCASVDAGALPRAQARAEASTPGVAIPAIPGNEDAHVLGGGVLHAGASARGFAAETAASGVDLASASQPHVSSRSPAPAAERGIPHGMEWIAASVAGLFLTSLLYSRLRRDLLAEQETRGRILAVIHSRPGTSTGQIALHLGIHPTTVAHHLRLLSRAGLVRVRAARQLRLCFPPGAAEERSLLPRAALHAPAALRLLRCVLEAPGMPLAMAAEHAGLHRVNASYHARRLAAAGLLTFRREGRTLRLFPAGDCSRFLDLEAAWGASAPAAWSEPVAETTGVAANPA